MPNLTLYNSLTKQKEAFKPTSPGKASLYHCGPTVYKRQHLGNMRRFLFADVLRRTLELLGYEVREITNITDVGHLTQDDLDAGEDKLAREAKRQKLTPQDIAERETKQFFADLKELNIQESHKYPRATEHIKEMQELIQQLLDKGIAYQTNSGIYFDVTKFTRYGALSGNTLAALEAGKRIEVRTDKQHPADFALWIFDTTALQKWESPWGTGYPGWHIECSAMSLAYLDQPIDIHTGGEDNKFPHHENEIAQAEAATGKKFVNYWLHNSHLQLAGAKLAKSEGTQLTLDTLRERGVSPLAFRLLVFGSHYRSKLDFSWESLAAAKEQLDSFKQLLRRLAAIQPTNDAKIDQTVADAFTAALADDLNTPQALAALANYVTKANKQLDASATSDTRYQILNTIYYLDRVLGIFAPLTKEIETETIPPEIQHLADQREQARQTGNFADADALRLKIEEAGYTIEDTPRGPRLIKK